jgi:Leucine-rich repeat (LRR) protein
MMILLITIFVAILLQVAFGQKCVNNRNIDYIVIFNCDAVSYQNLARDFQTEKITKFNAGSQNNEFPTIDQKMFRGMNNLDRLWLFDCKIEEIDENAFADLKYLSFLSLQENKIKTLHVNTFGYLGNLKNIYLYKNQIKELPAKLFERNLKLRILHMYRNKIKELPAGLFEILTDLEELAISDNQLKVIYGSTFRSNENLRRLWLQSNKIEAVAAGTFDGLTKVTLLDLENNTYINESYTSNEADDTIDLSQVSSDLSTCYANYEAYFRELITRESESHTSSDVSSTPMLMISPIHMKSFPFKIKKMSEKY